MTINNPLITKCQTGPYKLNYILAYNKLHSKSWTKNQSKRLELRRPRKTKLQRTKVQNQSQMNLVDNLGSYSHELSDFSFLLCKK